MQTKTRSATAYDKLSILTGQAELAGQLTYDWVRVVRALDALQSGLFLAEDTPNEVREAVDTFATFARAQRSIYRKITDDKQSAAITLNEQIQNGVYNDD